MGLQVIQHTVGLDNKSLSYGSGSRFNCKGMQKPLMSKLEAKTIMRWSIGSTKSKILNQWLESIEDYNISYYSYQTND